MDQLRESVMGILRDTNLAPDEESIASYGQEGSILLSPIHNTWSRSARRQATRKIPSSETQPEVNTGEESTEPIMRIRLSFQSSVPSTSESQAGDGDWRGATLTLDWLEGRDRITVEGFWKFLLTKAGLVGRVKPTQGGGRGGRAGRGRRGG